MERYEPLPRRIGLLADSHDRLDGLQRAIRILEDRGAGALIHLGDICDSLRLDLLEEAVRLIRDHRILAVKGNNDFMLENTLRSRVQDEEGREARLLAFLQGLPMNVVWDGICFAHSLPFENVRSFYDPVDTGSTGAARGIFLATAHRILFCGHSHRAVLFRYSQGKVSRTPIGAGLPVSLSPGDRYIIVTGSVLEGECAIFDTDSWHVEHIRIGVPG